MSALDAHEIAETIRDVVAAALDEIPSFDDTLLGAPERQLVTPGLPVDDCCEQLAVHIEPLSALAGRDNRNVGWMLTARYVITLGRCVPQPTVSKGKTTLPPVEDLEASSRQINADGWALHNALHGAVLSGYLGDRCGKAAFGPVTPRDPSGGCGGWTAEVTLTVDGYETALPES